MKHKQNIILFCETPYWLIRNLMTNRFKQGIHIEYASINPTVIIQVFNFIAMIFSDKEKAFDKINVL